MEVVFFRPTSQQAAAWRVAGSGNVRLLQNSIKRVKAVVSLARIFCVLASRLKMGAEALPSPSAL